MRRRLGRRAGRDRRLRDAAGDDRADEEGDDGGEHDGDEGEAPRHRQCLAFHYKRQKRCLIQRFDAELPRLLELAAGVGAGDDGSWSSC